MVKMEIILQAFSTFLSSLGTGTSPFDAIIAATQAEAAAEAAALQTIFTAKATFFASLFAGRK